MEQNIRHSGHYHHHESHDHSKHEIDKHDPLHCHADALLHHEHADYEQQKQKLGIACFLTLLFMFVELAVGSWTHSLALISDATHMLSDAGALAIAYAASILMALPKSHRLTYGFARASHLATFVNGSILILVAIGILSEAVQRLISPEEVMAWNMLPVAVVGLLLNLVLAYWLHDSHGHSHNHMKAAWYHLFFDTLGSIFAIISAVVMVLWQTYWIDAVASIILGFMMIYVGFQLWKSSAAVLMETVPAHISSLQVIQSIESYDGIEGVHDMHIWTVSEGFIVLTAHVLIRSDYDGVAVVADVSEMIQKKFAIDHVTLQPEVKAQTHSHDASEVEAPEKNPSFKMMTFLKAPKEIQ
jgi:cobalt-zinc-cadmium efflux system protein